MHTNAYFDLYCTHGWYHTYRLSSRSWKGLVRSIMGFHAALFVPTLCTCKGFIMLHKNGRWCTFLRYAVLTNTNDNIRAVSDCIFLYLSACFTQISSWLSSWMSHHVHVRFLVIHTRNRSHFRWMCTPGVPCTATHLLGYTYLSYLLRYLSAFYSFRFLRWCT